MYVKSARFSNFRNIISEELNFEPGITVIFGKNAQGKTNFIEGIYLLSAPRSFRGGLQSELITWGKESAELAVKVIDSIGSTDLSMTFENKKRQLIVDNNKVHSLAEFIGKLTTVCFSPADTALVKGSSIHRRQFVDKHLVDAHPQLFRGLMNYHRALRNKLFLLKNGGARKSMLTPWNELMAKEGIIIEQAKTRFISLLSENAAKIYNQFSNDDLELSIALKSDIKIEEGEKEFFQKLEEKAAAEILRGRSLFGIHKDEIEILLSGKNARAFASQGQSRSIALAMKLAIVSLVTEERGEAPVVLLDDIRSELDEERFSRLLKFVLSLKVQVFLTTTEFENSTSEGLVGGGKVVLFHAENGKIRHV
jgi:DNA replication and repair protein RecF